jgi:transcriptional regulator with XRE-family HTH domain
MPAVSDTELLSVFAANLRALRQLRALNQTTVALRAGLTQGLISHLERGTANPSIETLAALSRALDTTPGLLLTPGAFASARSPEKISAVPA